MRPPIEFEIDGVPYQARRPSIFVAGDIARKLAPLVASAIVQVAREIGAKTPGMTLGKAMQIALGLPMDRVAEMAVPFLRDFAAMSSEDFRFVVRECLMCVERGHRADGSTKVTWQPVWPPGLEEPILAEFRDDLFLVMRVVVSVIRGALGNFMPGSP